MTTRVSGMQYFELKWQPCRMLVNIIITIQASMWSSCSAQTEQLAYYAV